jgi:hypothetical protein
MFGKLVSIRSRAILPCDSAPPRKRDHVALHVLRTDQVFAKIEESSEFHLKSSKTYVSTFSTYISSIPPIPPIPLLPPLLPD